MPGMSHSGAVLSPSDQTSPLGAAGGLNNPTSSSAFVMLLPFSQQGSHVRMWSNQNIKGHSSYSWLSKGEVIALSASNHFPLALLIIVITVSIYEMSVLDQS